MGLGLLGITYGAVRGSGEPCSPETWDVSLALRRGMREHQPRILGRTGEEARSGPQP